MRYTSRHARACLLLLMIILVALPAASEPVRVTNADGPAEGLVTATCVEQWRAGGEDDEIFFGNVGRAAVDLEGNLLLLDNQLSEIQVYAEDGTHLRTIGREGDGPGEMRRPNDFYVMPDGNICVLQGFGGRISRLTSEGLPAGEATFTPATGSGQFSVMIRGLASGDGMLLAGIKMSFEGGINRQTYFLTRCAAEGQEQATLFEKQNTVDYSDFVLTETDMDFVWGRMAVGAGGRVFAAPSRDLYEVQVWNASGELERVITRSFEPLARNDERTEIQRKILEGIGANYPSPPRDLVVEEYDPVISNMWVTADGNLWVQTSRSDVQPPAGAWTALDVFDGRGNYVRQVALGGDHDALRDGIHILPDGRMVVVIGALDAYLNQQAVGGEEGPTAEEEAAPLEVICYELEM